MSNSSAIRARFRRPDVDATSPELATDPGETWASEVPVLSASAAVSVVTRRSALFPDPDEAVVLGPRPEVDGDGPPGEVVDGAAAEAEAALARRFFA